MILINLSLKDGLERAIKIRKNLLANLKPILSSDDYEALETVDDGNFWVSWQGYKPLNIDLIVAAAYAFHMCRDNDLIKWGDY